MTEIIIAHVAMLEIMMLMFHLCAIFHTCRATIGAMNVMWLLFSVHQTTVTAVAIRQL